MKSTSTVRSLIARHTTIALVLGAAAVLGVACGGGSDGGEGNTQGSGAGSGNGNGNGSTGTLMLTTGGGNMTSSGTGFQECATSSDEATLVPVNMIIMFDRSGSMESNNKWNDSTNALRAFLQDPGTAGLRVALRFFPTENVDGCSGFDCNVNDCSIPAVDSAALTADPAPTDTQEQLLVTAINNETPDGANTPISAALEGATNWARGYLQTNPAEKAVVIFVTDGAPNGCEEGSNQIAAIAAQALVDAGILTYSVGLEGSNETLMNLIADQGGTGQGIFIGAGANAEQELLMALQAIQGAQLACSFQMPQPAPGETIDPGLVNVEYTPPGGTAQTIPKVANAGACGNDGGWYYDNPTMPTRIDLCPTTCSAVQADAQGGAIRVIVGCETQVQ